MMTSQSYADRVMYAARFNETYKEMFSVVLALRTIILFVMLCPVTKSTMRGIITGMMGTARREVDVHRVSYPVKDTYI